MDKPRGKPHEKYRGVPNGDVKNGCEKGEKGGVIKGTCMYMYSYLGCKNLYFIANFNTYNIYIRRMGRKSVHCSKNNNNNRFSGF